MIDLVGLPYSPWSEKARWALELRHLPYRFRVYQPLLGEPRLRLLTRRLRGRVSVPVLRDGKRVVEGAGAIARFAEEQGSGEPLFPPGAEAEVARFEALAERGLEAGRALSLARMLEDGEALREMVPRPLRTLLGPAAERVASLGVHRTFRKYGCHEKPLAAHRAELEAVLDELARALAASPSGDAPRTLLTGFSFADVAMAQPLAFVAPPSAGLRLGRASRRAFTDTALAARFSALVTWRDAVYARWR